jgi:cysteine desulfurase family protein (TIGR01976 family)
MQPFPIDQVRSQFPALQGASAFLDNPAGTQVPRVVIDAVGDALVHAASNLGGAFEASQRADAIWVRAHDSMAELLGGASGAEITLGQSMTMLTFHLSRSLGRLWKAGDEIIVTRMDHEGNVAPWVHMAADHGLTVRWLPFNKDTWRIEPADLASLLNDRTRLLALNYASNLTGSINPVAELTQLAQRAGALVYIDAVQAVPHVLADVAQIGCDFLACSSYKFFGPHMGVLWGRQALMTELYAYAARCATKTMPGRHELGTPQTELLAGVAAAADYMVWLGGQCGATGTRREKIAAAYSSATNHEMPLAQFMMDELRRIPKLKVQGITESNRLHVRVPTVSVTHADFRNSFLARELGAQGINVWSGHNYAYEVARYLGLDEEEGVLRIGLAHYNTRAEVERIVAALRRLMGVAGA